MDHRAADHRRSAAIVAVTHQTRNGRSRFRPEAEVHKFNILFLLAEMAERGRFELPIRLPVCRISSAVHSTTLRPLWRAKAI
jgi:hypothetical protein